MIDVNYDKCVKYLDPNSKEPKLVKNAPASAKKAFEAWQYAEAKLTGKGMDERLEKERKMIEKERKASNKK